MRNFCSAKVPYIFSAKSIAAVDFVITVRLKKFSTNDFVQLMMLQTTAPRKSGKLFFRK